MGSLDIAIQVEGLSKAYKIYASNRDLLIEAFCGKPRHRDHWALRDVSFKIPRGHVVGVIGPNGSGKSTLLKIITGLLDATAGKVEVNGRVSAILELGTGFHPDFTGRENIITGGMCIGMSREEIESKLPWIIEFSELEDVLDEPFRTYSSGMQARLTFSTAIAMDPEIFIVDEALAAGDAYFVSKCMKRIREICDSGATVLFVSHSTSQVAMLCDTAIWIESGRVRDLGPAREVTRRYDYTVHARLSNKLGQIIELDVPDTNHSETNEQEKRPDLDNEMHVGAGDETVCAPKNAPVFRRGPVFIDRVTFLSGDGKPETMFRTWDRFVICVDYRLEGPPPSHDLGVGVAIERDRDLLLVAQFGTTHSSGCINLDRRIKDTLRKPFKIGSMLVDLGELQLLEGDYLISVGLLPNIANHVEFYEYHHRLYRIRVIPAGYSSGSVVYPRVDFRNIER
jgi:ABC-type polysaccharide/polyol phosphate transport system ATPase subunit